jgi:hypothetical protein
MPFRRGMLAAIHLSAGEVVDEGEQRTVKSLMAQARLEPAPAHPQWRGIALPPVEIDQDVQGLVDQPYRVERPGCTVCSGCCPASRTRFIRRANSRLAARLAKTTLPLNTVARKP